MEIRPFEAKDAPALAELAAFCARGENDFVLNPFWETEAELFAEFARFGLDPTTHMLVADDDGAAVGMVGYLRQDAQRDAGLICPIVRRDQRGRGVGGQLLRAARDLARDTLDIRLVTAGIGTRNRGGYSLLTSLGFRPVRQHFLMRCEAPPKPAIRDLAGYEFRAAEPGDADEILALYLACGFERRSPEFMRSVLTDGRHQHSVAHDGQQVVAFCEIETHWPNRVWVSYIGVDPKRRDRGLGTALVAWSLDAQFRRGTSSALLMLSPANRSALRAYEKSGFKRFRLIDVLETTF